MAKMIGKMDYNAWMKQLILDPLEMKDTSFRLESRSVILDYTRE